MSLRPGHHRQAYAYCAYCPKVCRFACPVSESTHSETTSTWGKMTQAFLVHEGHRALEPAGAQALYACTGCMRCRSFCKHQNEVGFALFSSRQHALDSGTAPEGASRTVETFARSGNPFGKDLAAAARPFLDRRAGAAFFPGCTSLVRRPELVEDALAAGEGLGEPMQVSPASARCCGYPLYAAGDQAGFARHAAQVADALGNLEELTVADPGCAYTLAVVYPRVGVKLKTRVRTVFERWAARLASVAGRPRVLERAAYHDACHLGRGLGQYDQPRRLVAAAVGTVVEAREAREEGGCSGGGGLLPRTQPENAADIAARQAAKLGAAEDVVVTACPTSARQFERAGRQALDLVTLVRRWAR